MMIHWTYESDIGNLSSLFKLIIYPSFKLLIQGSDSQCVCLLLTHRQPPEYTVYYTVYYTVPKRAATNAILHSQTYYLLFSA